MSRSASHLKKDVELRPIPVIMVSAREMDQDVIRGLDAGAHDYVTKPFNTQIVLARIRSAARAKESHDLIAEMNQAARRAGHDRRADGTQEPSPFPRFA